MKSMGMIRILAVLSGAVAQVAFGALPFILDWSETVASRSNAIPSLITPASYAFSIWGVLFLGSAIFALYHAVRPAHAPMRRIGWWAALAFWGNALWEIYVPFFGFDLVSVVIIAGIWGSLLILCGRAQSDPGTGVVDAVFRAPLFALTGWLNAAVFVNIQVAALTMGVPFLRDGTEQAALTVLGFAVIAASVSLWRFGSPLLASAFAWGLWAIRASAVENGNSLISNACLVALALVAVALAAGWLRRRSA